MNPVKLNKLIDIVNRYSGKLGKSALAEKIQGELQLTKDRSVYSCTDFAIRFSTAKSRRFGNTVLSLSALQKYDHLPFLICLVTPDKNFVFLANSTFLKKVSHSSQELRTTNIRGSFNGSDIAGEFEGIVNEDKNIDRLFQIHSAIGFVGNLERLVEATTGIVPSGNKFLIDEQSLAMIASAPDRAEQFVSSTFYQSLRSELDEKVKRYKNEILLAALIENVNVRGRIIEYLIAGEDNLLREKLISALGSKSDIIPEFKTENDLGDYRQEYPRFITETDVKTKIMILDSNPKGYNLDKMLAFLSEDKSVFLFYFVGIDPGSITSTALVSMFENRLLKSTILLKHWAGRNSRGVSQFEGRTIKKILSDPSNVIDLDASKNYLSKLVDL